MKRFSSFISGFSLIVCMAAAGAAEPADTRLAQADVTDLETLVDTPTTQKALKVGTKEIVPFVFLNEEVPYGFSVELWNRIADDLGLQTEWVRYDSVGDMLEGLSDGQIDTAIAGISITAKRESQQIDFTYPFYRSGLQLMVRAKSTNPIALMVSGLLSWRFWQPMLLVLATSAGVGILVWMVEHEHNDKFSGSPIEGIGQGIWFSIVTLGTFGYGDVTPDKLPGRIIAVVWMGASFFIVADFIASLTVGQLSTSQLSIEDLRGEKVAVVDGTTGERYTRSQPVEVIEFKLFDSALAALESGSVEAIVHDYPTLKYIASRDPDTFELAGAPLTQEDYGVAFREGAEMAEIVSQEILELQEQGYLRSLREKWFGSSRDER
ncbi:transporter substrate-binding domain-containing protein [cf. Phormidesmis sp. LEGE 11477]|uniref:transporter substrate-binding domain-containing protein n=1 Tax=cf. Phormidesmis sp. LEGE 11477 TaxID=1828680 RepID=UPI00187E5DB0|nr:transporter substrate-binding domain-containing protein [cf. Phormidesmis sp. LEGE 11477]MBE9063535.1 transporter substrate-binding domain-containing protein [cf. Phormidesmis sp. LEGE 11477]